MPNFHASIVATKESQLLLAARRRRKSLMLRNDTHRYILVGLDKPATIDGFTTKLSPDQEWHGPEQYDGSVNVAIDDSRQPFEVDTGRTGLVTALEVF